ncbi:MAG: Rossmann-like domain-containing protein [Beutenbergiaceae bacterium]
MHPIYDALLADLPAERVHAGAIAPVWTWVIADGGTGIAMTPPQSYQLTTLRGQVAGMTLPDLARYVHSWNFHEAALGLAAVNAFRNRAHLLGQDDRMVVTKPGRGGSFGGLEAALTGKKVAVIGHGPHIRQIQDRCQLTVLERLPQAGDLPDPACEYVLPEQDFVFITATALENKTMPRLLELSASAFTAIIGPSTPLSPLLFGFGVDALFGYLIDDADQVVRVAGEGGYFKDFHAHTTRVDWFADAAMVPRAG